MDGPTVYDKLVLRLKDYAYHQCRGGLAVVVVRVIFVEGEPRLFSEPEVTQYDPGNRANGEATAARETLIAALTDG